MNLMFFIGFNSIKVRLKRTAKRAGKPPYKFQFHKGAIKTFDGFFEGEIILVSIP